MKRFYPPPTYVTPQRYQGRLRSGNSPGFPGKRRHRDRWWICAGGDSRRGTTVAAHLPALRLGDRLRAAWPWLRPWLHWLIRLLLLALLQQDTPDVA